MSVLVPVLNPGPKKRSKKVAKKKSYTAAAVKAGAVHKRGPKKGRPLKKEEAAKKGIRIPGFVTPTMIKQAKSSARAARPKKTSSQQAAKTKRGTSAYRSSRRAKGKKAYTRSGYPNNKITWLEAAYASGAVYPEKYPEGHPKSGEKHPRAGEPMTKKDALTYQRPVIGYLNRDMIKRFYDKALTPGGSITSSKKKLAEAYAQLEEDGKVMKKLRKELGSGWLRATERYTRSGKTPKGKTYKKGERRPSFYQYWSSKPAAWQSGGGQHLRVRFRKGRGPVTRIPVYRGFSPSESAVAMLEAGGFGGPTDAPGGTVKLNRGSRRKPSRRRKTRRKNPARRKSTAKRRRKKTTSRRKNPPKRKRKSKAKRKRRVRAYNPSKRRRKKSKAKRRKNPGHKKRMRRNPAKGRRRRKRRVKKNPGQAQLSQLKSQKFWLTVAHVGLGFTGTAMLGAMIQRAPLIRDYTHSPGGMGVAARFASNMLGAVGVSMAAYYLRSNKLVGQQGYVTTLVAGAAYSALNAIAELSGSPLIPMISVPASGAMSSGMSGYYDPLLPHGSYPGQYPGMGAVMSPEDLVAGESLARNVNEFSGMGDFLELSGLGSSGGTPVPLEDLRGMGDFMEFNPGSGLVQAGFDPGSESF